MTGATVRRRRTPATARSAREHAARRARRARRRRTQKVSQCRRRCVARWPATARPRGHRKPWAGCGRDAAAAEPPWSCISRDVVGACWHAAAAGGEMDYDGAVQTRRAPGKRAAQQPLPGPRAARTRRAGVGSGCREAENCQRDALTARAAVLTIDRSKGSKRKDSRVDEEALIAWQDVLDMVLNGRPNEVGCPYCNHRPLTIEEIEQM